MKIALYCNTKSYQWLLVLGFIILSNVGLYLYLKHSIGFLQVLSIITAAVVLFAFYYRTSHPMYVIDDEIIVHKHPFYGRTIELSKIKQIKYFAGDYTLIMADQSLVISKEKLREKDQDKLASILKLWQERLEIKNSNKTQ